MKSTLARKLTITASAAALALGAAACDVEDPGDLDGDLDDPVLEDDGLDDDL